MGLTRKRLRTWLCPECRTTNAVRTSSRRCQGCGENTKPARRVPKHKRVLHELGYAGFAQVNETIHGRAVPEVAERNGYACGVCGRLPSENRKLDRDHDHRTGHARGLACGGDSGCNVLMLPWVTAQTAAGIYAAKLGAGEQDAERWRLIAQYLRRVEEHYG